MSIKGSPYARFQRSLETRKLSIVLVAAAELQSIQLDDALEILILMADEKDPRFDRAAARWGYGARACTRHELSLAEALPLWLPTGPPIGAESR